MLKVLLVEDEIHNRETVAELIARLGHEVTLADNGRSALEKINHFTFDLILSDVRMPLLDGMQLFDAVQQLNYQSKPFFAFMTAYGRLEDAVELMRKGAQHFLTKPLRKKNLQELLTEVSKLKEGQQKKIENKKKQLRTLFGEPVFVSRAFAELIEVVDRIAPTQASVLITGESGVGKELIAQRIHLHSSRAEHPFVAFHAGSVPDTLLESELFGHEKGAFTGAEQEYCGEIRKAHRGTFFIDEVATMSLALQTKLLRVLQDKQIHPLGSLKTFECDVRWVAATNESLNQLVQEGRFREDLLFRLNVIELYVPPLRERPEDILHLTRFFLKEFAASLGQEELLLREDTANHLLGYHWPGNIRELKNVIERATALATDNQFVPALLPERIQIAPQRMEIKFSVGTSLQTVENRLIEETLGLCKGDKVKAAQILGIAPRTLYRWIERNQESK